MGRKRSSNNGGRASNASARRCPGMIAQQNGDRLDRSRDLAMNRDQRLRQHLPHHPRRRFLSVVPARPPQQADHKRGLRWAKAFPLSTNMHGASRFSPVVNGISPMDERMRRTLSAVGVQNSIPRWRKATRASGSVATHFGWARPNGRSFENMKRSSMTLLRVCP